MVVNVDKARREYKPVASIISSVTEALTLPILRSDHLQRERRLERRLSGPIDHGRVFENNRTRLR
jgi:hypothetical protein